MHVPIQLGGCDDNVAGFHKDDLETVNNSDCIHQLVVSLTPRQTVNIWLVHGCYLAGFAPIDTNSMIVIARACNGCSLMCQTCESGHKTTMARLHQMHQHLSQV